MCVQQPVIGSSAQPPKVSGKSVSPEQPRETAEYQAAVELEMWKESQEQMFENQVSFYNSLHTNKQLPQFRLKLSQFSALLQ